MASIIEFLEARIGEDEALAVSVIAKCDPDDWENPAATGNFWPEEVAFWDGVTPYRVLAECAAKRTIIDNWEDPDDIGPLDGDVDAGHVLATDNAVRAIAAIYADHPDYRQEWARG